MAKQPVETACRALCIGGGKTKCLRWKCVQFAHKSKEECKTFGYVLMAVHMASAPRMTRTNQFAVQLDFTFIHMSNDMDSSRARGSKKRGAVAPVDFAVSVLHGFPWQGSLPCVWFPRRLWPVVFVETIGCA